MRVNGPLGRQTSQEHGKFNRILPCTRFRVCEGGLQDLGFVVHPGPLGFI